MNAVGFPSDTNMLVERCLLRVREAAHLDDDPVLPPPPPASARKDVVVLSKAELPLPSAKAIVAAASERNQKRAAKKTVVTARRSRPARWPVLLCGFIAGVAAGASFMTSPLAEKPAVRSVTHAVRAELGQAAREAIATIHEAL